MATLLIVMFPAVAVIGMNPTVDPKFKSNSETLPGILRCGLLDKTGGSLRVSKEKSELFTAAKRVPFLKRHNKAEALDRQKDR